MASQTLRHCSNSATIDLLSEDILHNIIARLPATSFASATCVSRSFTLVCDRILCRPKLSSACSLNPSLQAAVEEVVNKVLSEPIRPHFAIASVGGWFGFQHMEDVLKEAHSLITKSLGTPVPLITNRPSGIIGRDAISDEFKEIPLRCLYDPDAIMLTVGYLPRMKVRAIPLSEQNEETETHMIGEFVTDIRKFSTSVSGCNSPAAIMMFSFFCLQDMFHEGVTAVVEKIENAMSPETVIVGDHISPFRYTNDTHDDYAAVGLVFAVDRNKPPGIGDIQFHVFLSSRLSPIGPAYKAGSVREKNDDSLTWLKARREGSFMNIDGRNVLNQVYYELGAYIRPRNLYIGVTKKRKCSIGQEKAGCMTSLAFHQVSGYSGEYLCVCSEDIKTGDTFRFYHTDSTIALSSVAAVSRDLRYFNQGSNDATSGDKQEVFGGLIFSCGGEDFFGQPNIDSSPFLDNFPGVTLGGTLCSHVIGRGVLTQYVKESQGEKKLRCCMHAHSAVYYLIMSYIP